MSYNARGALLCAVYVLGLLAIVNLGLLVHGALLYVLVGLAVVTATVVIVQPSLVSLALGLTYAFAFTTTWGVVSLGPLRPSDLCFAGGLIAFVAAGAGRPDRWPRIPVWVLQLALVIVVVAALNEVIPYDPNYLAHRVFLDSNGLPSVQVQSNITLSLKWLIAIIGVPALVGFAVRWRPRAIYRIAAAYALGAAVNGWVAVSDRLHFTHLGPRLLGVTYGTRQTGLALHPVHLAEACSLGAPLACWLVAHYRGWRRIVALFTLAGTVGGVYFSGSRAGAVVVALSVVAVFLLLRSLRVRIVQLAGVAAVVALGFFIKFPQLVDTVSSTTRLGNSASTDFSDQARAILAGQAADDFRHSPIYGNGLQLALSSHDIFRQSLAAGGIILLMSLVVFLGLSLLRAAEYARIDPLGVAVAVTVTAFIVLGATENFLTDRYLYVPFALAMAAGAPERLRLRRGDRNPADAQAQDDSALTATR
jgi:hypothetical protein